MVALCLYDNAFSPFARKVRLALDLKGISYTTIDGLALANRDGLAAVHGRVEVPVIDHGGTVVSNSSDIVAYLERVFPSPPLYPEDHAEFAQACAWERCADTVVDAVLINVSYWAWAERDDHMPEGWLEAARNDIGEVYVAVERDLAGRDFLSGNAVSIADVALYPHLTAARTLGLGYDLRRFPRLHAWLKRLRALPPFAADTERAKAFLAEFVKGNAHERRKIFWRGDRLEWVLAHGFHRWLETEIESDRVIWPGLGIPKPRRG